MKKTKLCFERGSEGRQGRKDDKWGVWRWGGGREKEKSAPPSYWDLKRRVRQGGKQGEQLNREDREKGILTAKVREKQGLGGLIAVRQRGMDSRCILETELTRHASAGPMKEVGHVSKERGMGEIPHLGDVCLEMALKAKGWVSLRF